MKRLLIIYYVLFTAFYANAGVDLRSGVFYMSYTDLEFTGTNADVTRTYNSNTSTTGLFGYGWRSLIESKLHAFPDGTLSLSWWGGNVGDFYEPATLDRSGLNEMVNAIINDLIAANKLGNDPVSIAEKRSYYLVNHKKRAEKYIELQDKRAVPLYTPPAGEHKRWILDVNQVVKWTGKYFDVKSWEDRYEFSPAGLLIKVDDRAYTMDLHYNGTRLSRIIVNNSDTCLVNINSAGRITKLFLSVNGSVKMTEYTYDSLQNLLYSKDAGDNEYRYSYDLYHNLVRISYADSSSMQMTYDPASNRLITLKNRQGSYTTYQYPFFYSADGRINYDHFATTVQQFDSTGKLYFTQYKEFEHRPREDGSTYLHRMVEKSDTSFHEVLYDPEVGNARFRNKNNKLAWATYDSKQRPAYLHINDSIYRSRYNISDLPEYFIATDSLRHDSIVYRYRYAASGQLVETQKNNQYTSIRYSVTGDTMYVHDDRESLSVFLAGDKPYSVHHQRWGSALVEKLTDEALQPELWKLYRKFSDVIVPKKIAHEWLWERL